MREVNYTGKNIVTIEVYKKYMKEEIDRVRGLTGGRNSVWVHNPRPEGVVWAEDPIRMMPGAAGKKGRTMVAAGIEFVKDIVGKSDEEIKELKKNTPGISIVKLTEWRNYVPCEGACPHTIVDHRKAPNPYLSRYGEDLWESKINTSVFMNKYMCVTELVKGIYEASEQAFIGTTHENDWYFYHDALSQMTAKSTRAWMQEQGYYSRWLIPQLGLNSGTVYVARPVGNRPEFMPLDNSLNADIQYALSLHCAITAHLDDDDERKFSMATPLTIVRGIRRLWGNEGGNVPSSRRICKDCDRALRAFGEVYRHEGKMVKGLANRNGHRNHAEGRNTEGWGGLRIKNLLVEEVDRWLHAHAIEAKTERTQEVLIRLSQNDSDEESSDVE